MFQKGGFSRSNRLRLLPFDKVAHALRRALLRYAQIAQLATHARYLHALQCTRGFVIPQTTEFGFSKRWVSFHKTTRIFDGVEQFLFNGCSMVVQWLFNGCHHALSPPLSAPLSASSMNAIRFLLRRGGDFAWNEWSGGSASLHF